MCVFTAAKEKIKIKNRALVTAQQRDLCDQPWKHKTCDGEGKEEHCKNLASPLDQEMPSKTCWMISSWVSYFSWGWCEKAGLAARSQVSMCAYCMDSAWSIRSQAEQLEQLDGLSPKWIAEVTGENLSIHQLFAWIATEVVLLFQVTLLEINPEPCNCASWHLSRVQQRHWTKHMCISAFCDITKVNWEDKFWKTQQHSERWTSRTKPPFYLFHNLKVNFTKICDLYISVGSGDKAGARLIRRSAVHLLAPVMWSALSG